MSAAEDNDDDDVFDVLQEAQALMEEMGDEEGVDAIVIDGFSIDDVLDDPPIIDARTVGGTGTATGGPAPIKVEVGEDPLSMVNSAAGAATGTADSPRRSSLTLHPLTDEQVAPAKATTLTAPSLADVKARASGFASTISNFAQKAANAAVEAAQQNARNVQQHQQNHHQQQQQQNQYASYPIAAPPAHSHPMELDNDQKTALIQQHLGTLLPGERVIMFLPNLLHVSDSTGWELNAFSDGMWCCCMTFYRVVLFHTGTTTTTTTTTTTNAVTTTTTTTTTPPSDWDVDCWPVPPTTPVMLQMPLASMDRVEKSIYTTAQNTTLMGLVMYGYVP